jgi:hypothetical protein
MVSIGLQHAVEQGLAPDKALELKMPQDGLFFINARFAGEARCSTDLGKGAKAR